MWQTTPATDALGQAVALSARSQVPMLAAELKVVPTGTVSVMTAPVAVTLPSFT